MRIALLPLYALLGALMLGPAAGEEDDAPAAAAPGVQAPELSAIQQQAVGITLIHPLRAHGAERIEGYGEVLDASALATDAGRLASARIAEAAAAAEARRLRQLYGAGTDASLRAVESAEATQAEAQTQVQVDAAALAAQWGPLAELPPAQLAGLSDALARGRGRLLRADIPGRQRLEGLPTAAVLQVDGTEIPARVLGTLLRGAAETQGVALLLQVETAPQGLTTGARVLVSLSGRDQQGVLVPAAALLYGDQGAYVYRQLAASGAGGAGGKLRYAPAAVRLLQPRGAAWLVSGIDSDDLIVASGAGVLWSLQGLGTFSAEEEEHD